MYGLRTSIDTEEAHLYQSLASHLIYANPALRAPGKILLQGMGPQSALWPQGISGDSPILLVRIDDATDIELIRQLLHAFEYWKTKRLKVDLVILNDRASSYAQDLQGTIEALVRKISTPRTAGGPGDMGQVFTLRADLLSQETLRVLPAVARVVLYGRRGDVASQLPRSRDMSAATSVQHSEPPRLLPAAKAAAISTSQLEFFNGFGGFSEDGREYVTVFQSDRPTPAPWIGAGRTHGLRC